MGLGKRGSVGDTGDGNISFIKISIVSGMLMGLGKRGGPWSSQLEDGGYN